MTELHLNRRALEIVERMVDDADALRIAVRTAGGARVVDCGARAPGGYGAGIACAAASLGGLGSVAMTPVVAAGRTLPGVEVTTDHPAIACLGAQYGGWRLEHEGFLAMGSGPARALARLEPVFERLDLDERADRALLTLETRDDPPAELVARVAEQVGVAPGELTLLIAPAASVAGGIAVAARVVETAMQRLVELGADPHTVISASGSCPLPPVAADDAEAIGRSNDAVMYGASVHLTVDLDDATVAALAPGMPSSASSAHGQPFGAVLADAGWDFHAIDPELFGPAAVALTSTRSGRTHLHGEVRPEVLDRSFWG